ncbi:LOW QUALITY PROTEIN: fucolectin-5-like [Anableps anableps]
MVALVDGSLASVTLPWGSCENLALQGKASQSSLHGVYLPYNAIDENRDNQLTKASCSHTSNDFSPWWRLDMCKTRKVFSIKIVNRDSAEERLNGAEICIGDSLDNNGNNNPRCAVITVSSGKSLYEFDCNGMEGRYNIVIPGRSEFLTLCEVEVYGSTLE